jgi:hypothetical protein
MAFFLAPRCSFWFSSILGVEVDDARDGSWRHCFTMWHYLAAKPSHMGVNVGRLACPCIVLRPTAIRRGDSASCQALSCPITAVGGGAFPGM